MEKSNRPLIPQKSNSFSFHTKKSKLQESDRNFSLRFINLDPNGEKTVDFLKNQITKGGQTEKSKNADNGEKANQTHNFVRLLQDIDLFLASLMNPEQSSEPPEIPERVIGEFLDVVEKVITKYGSGDEVWVPEHDDHPLLATIERIAIINSEISKHCSEPEPRCIQIINRSGSILHRCMAFLEDEFHLLLLEDHNANLCCIVAPPEETESESVIPTLPYTPEIVERLRGIVVTMISAGYITECCQVFATARHNAFHSSMLSLGYERYSIDDVLHMTWETLEGQIPNWIKSCQYAINKAIPCERELVDKVFACYTQFSSVFLQNLAREAIINHLTFPEAVVMTTRSTEKLFKVLDMYETLKKSELLVNTFLLNEGEADDPSLSYNVDLKSEVTSTRSHLGESAVAIFCDLESSIKADSSKVAMPGGAVHPLTRYVMNYLKLACEYKNTMEQVFKEHYKPARFNDDLTAENDNDNDNDTNNPFASQLIKLMDLLNGNIEEKSRLYKDASLSYIFLMNNGGYMGQKIKGSEEIRTLLGASWARKRFSELRTYHKNYQRETWSKVLACLKVDDGLMVKGTVQKPVLKECFKSFNSMFEDIHKAQSGWVVTDEQLKSELKISVSAVLIPAYRSFMGRFEQQLSSGRHKEKYIKFSPEDLEKYIEDLFEGNPMSMARKK